MKSILGIILILAGVALAYYGVLTIQENSASVEFLDIEIDTSDKSGVEQGYLYIGLAVVLFGGGIFTLKSHFAKMQNRNEKIKLTQISADLTQIFMICYANPLDF